MKIGLFFGSFNPVHNGHMIIANYMLEYSDLNKIWFVISPQNPFKKKTNLLADYHRYELLNLVLENTSDYEVTDIEFKMPKPSYTIDTLTYLREKHPKKEFILIMGSDNLQSFKKWKNSEIILQNHELYVYPRPDYDGGELKNNAKVNFINAPLMEISSSFIRKAVKEKKEVRFFMPEKAYNYMREMHFYEK